MKIEEQHRLTNLLKSCRFSKEGGLTIKQGNKSFDIKKLQDYFWDKQEIDLSRTATQELIVYFNNLPDAIQTQQGTTSSLVNFFDRPDVYYFVSYDGKQNQVSNLKTFQGIPNVDKKVLLEDCINQRIRDSVDEIKLVVSDKTRTSLFQYDPYSNKKYYIDQKSKMDTLNRYIPPSHSFIERDPKEPPRLIIEFLRHFLDQQEDQVDYVLDWMSNLLHRRTIPYLTLIGEQGVGKNTLVDYIIGPLVGKDNTTTVTMDRMKKEFNKFLQENQVILYSEMFLNDPKILNKLKSHRDEFIEIEGKGENVIEVKNSTSGVITTNDISEVRIERNERRYSFLKLTDINLTKSEYFEKNFKSDNPFEEFQIGIEKEIPMFYWWLKKRSIVNDNMGQPFINTEHFDNIHEMSKSSSELWIDKFLDDKSGQEISIEHLFEDGTFQFKNFFPKETKIYNMLTKDSRVEMKRKETPIGKTMFFIKGAQKFDIEKYEEKKFEDNSIKINLDDEFSEPLGPVGIEAVKLNPKQILEKYGVKKND